MATNKMYVFKWDNRRSTKTNLLNALNTWRRPYDIFNYTSKKNRKRKNFLINIDNRTVKQERELQRILREEERIKKKRAKKGLFPRGF